MRVIHICEFLPPKNCSTGVLVQNVNDLTNHRFPSFDSSIYCTYETDHSRLEIQDSDAVLHLHFGHDYEDNAIVQAVLDAPARKRVISIHHRESCDAATLELMKSFDLVIFLDQMDFVAFGEGLRAVILPTAPSFSPIAGVNHMEMMDFSTDRPGSGGRYSGMALIAGYLSDAKDDLSLQKIIKNSPDILFIRTLGVHYGRQMRQPDFEADNLRYLHMVSDATLSNLFRLVDAFVCIYREGFTPRHAAAMTAISHSTPLLTTFGEHTPWTFIDGKNMFDLKGRDLNIKSLLEDMPEWRNLHYADLKYLRSIYSLDSHVAALVQWYHQL